MNQLATGDSPGMSVKIFFMNNNKIKIILFTINLSFSITIFAQREVYRLEDSARHRKAMISDVHLHSPKKDSSAKYAPGRDSCEMNGVQMNMRGRKMKH